jgi:hypothetical protein
MRGWQTRCMMGAVGWRLLILAVCLTGCAESQLAELPPMQQTNAMLPPVDTFWLQQSVAALHEPPPLPVRSISLGYVGDAPLAGGVMRNTPLAPVQVQLQPAPCACALRNE